MSVGHQRPVHTQRPDLILDDGDLVAGIPRDEPMSRRAVFSTSKCQARLRPSRRLAFSRASLGKYQGIQCATSSGFVQTPQALRLRPSSLHRESRSGSSPAPAGQNVSLLLLATEGKGDSTHKNHLLPIILQQASCNSPIAGIPPCLQTRLLLRAIRLHFCKLAGRHAAGGWLMMDGFVEQSLVCACQKRVHGL